MVWDYFFVVLIWNISKKYYFNVLIKFNIMDNLEIYVGYILSNVVYSEVGYWHTEIEDLVQGTIDIKEIEDLDQLEQWHKAFVKHSDGIQSVLSKEGCNIYIRLYCQIAARKGDLRCLQFLNELSLQKLENQKFKTHGV